MFSQKEATKIIKEKISSEHNEINSNTIKIEWVEYSEITYPTGYKETFGVCAVSAKGYMTRGFNFSIDKNDGIWRMYQCNKAMNKIANIL